MDTIIAITLQMKKIGCAGFCFVFFFLLFFFFLFLAAPHTACGILVPLPGVEPTLHALEAGSLNNWTAREVQN